MEWGEEAVFAVVSWEEYVLHAARQLRVLVALECFATMRHVMKTIHKLVFLNSFPPTDTPKHNLQGFFFSIMEKSLSVFLRRLLLRAVLHNGVSKVKVSCG